MTNEFENKTILVTGGTGTIGSALVEQLFHYRPKQIRVLSRDESKQYALLEKLNYPGNLRLLIGDIRDRQRIDLAFKDVDIVFHAAALKHVPFCEYNPFEVVKTNIIGSQNVVDAALQNHVSKVVAISTDKVVNPVGVMGVSKLMMEKLIINTNYYKGNAETIFSCVRFGNVAWARGSVFHLWKEQVQRGEAIKVTNDRMTRFIMSKQDAINLVLKAAQCMVGGEIFVLKMPAIKMIDAAKIFITKYCADKDPGIQIIGARAGEKLHEELIGVNRGNDEVFEDDDMFIIVPNVQVYGSPKTEIPVRHDFREARDFGGYTSDGHIDAERVAKII